jgi:hypothetical protein
MRLIGHGNPLRRPFMGEQIGIDGLSYTRACRGKQRNKNDEKKSFHAMIFLCRLIASNRAAVRYSRQAQTKTAKT